MKVQHGARVADPRGDEVLLAPGLTLEQVKAELAEARVAPRPDRRALLDDVRAAFAEEASAITTGDELVIDVIGGATSPRRDHVEGGGERAGTRVLDRSDDPHGALAASLANAARIVVLRDHRRGRPTRPSS